MFWGLPSQSRSRDWNDKRGSDNTFAHVLQALMNAVSTAGVLGVLEFGNNSLDMNKWVTKARLLFMTMKLKWNYRRLEALAKKHLVENHAYQGSVVLEEDHHQKCV